MSSCEEEFDITYILTKDSSSVRFRTTKSSLSISKLTSNLTVVDSVEKFEYGIKGLEKLKFESRADGFDLRITSIGCVSTSSCVIWGFPISTKKEFKQLFKELDCFYPALRRIVENPFGNTVYLARYRDDPDIFYRAMVIEKNISSFKVFYLDYGNVSDVALVFEIPQNFTFVRNAAAQAIPVVICEKPFFYRQLTPCAIDSINLSEGRTVHCVIDSISRKQPAFAGKCTVEIGSGNLDLRSLLVTENRGYYLCNIL